MTPELVEQVNPDAVIVASGSTYVYPNIPGIEMDKVKTVSDVENHRVPVGENVVVCGGGIVGLECAVMLGMEGKKVTVIDHDSPWRSLLTVCRCSTTLSSIISWRNTALPWWAVRKSRLSGKTA